MNKIKETILTEQRLGSALRYVRDMMNDNGLQEFGERLEQIQSDYQLMCSFARKGFADPKREEVYAGLLKKLYRVHSDMMLAMKRKNTAGLTYYSHYSFNNIQHDDIRQRLEAFVQDIALLSLETDGGEKKHQVYKEHHELMTALFYHVMMSNQWDEETQNFYQDLLLSPTIDTIDAQLLTSAVTLAMLVAFDARKFSTLLYLYRYATDPNVKQRALVGWVLTMPENETTLFPEIKDNVQKVAASEAVRRELLELQYQLIFCIDADKDTQQISKEIMPGILKNQEMQLGPQSEEERLQEIINPNASEQAMEQIENSYMKMMDMQKKGVDIYFGGFSQMKRFPFFNLINNWFCPFYPEHPELKPISGLDENRFIRNLFESSPFCNSDKYSFTLAMSMVINQIPQNLREVISGDNLFMQENTSDYKDTPAYIRRIYLQDLYRFFRVCNLRSSFTNPFERKFNVLRNSDASRAETSAAEVNSSGLFFVHPILLPTGIWQFAGEIGNFLLNRKNYKLLLALTSAAPTSYDNNADWIYLCAVAALNNKRYNEALTLFKKLLDVSPESSKAIAGCVEAAHACRASDDEEKYAQMLYNLEPENTRNAMQLALLRMNGDRVEEAMEILFKLNYEMPDDRQILRMIVRGELLRAKPDAARKICAKLMYDSDNAIAEDYLYHGYCLWFTANIEDAVAAFRKFVELKRGYGDNVVKSDCGQNVLYTTFDNDMNSIIERNEHSRIDADIIVDIVAADDEA